MELLYIILTCLVTPSFTQLVSPCPRLFKYEPRGKENDRWYGTVTLLSETELNGVWLRLIFDKPSIQLGNWFGEVVTTDNKEYLVKNRNHKLLPNTPYNLRFYLKFNSDETPPQLTMFRLNARTVCPEGTSFTEPPITTGELITSNPVPSKPAGGRPHGGNKPPQPGGYNPQTAGGSNLVPSPGFGVEGDVDEEEDFFPGDFSPSHHPFNKPNRPGPSPTSEFACGSVVVPPRPLITHGQGTHEGEFPWHAALYYTQGIGLTYICGASLISKSHLITVAHCVTKRKSQRLLDPANLVVYLGKYYLKKWSDSGIQNKNVEGIFVHPKYNAQTFSDDIAIIKLSSPVQITDYVRPVCLWEEDLHLQAVINKTGTVVGWGFDASGRVTEQLTKAKMPIVSLETCVYSFPEFYSRFTSDKTYCAGFKNGTSVCNGDSGGGMVFPKANSNPHNPRWQLRGLVSISVALQNQLKCDASHYVVFTDVAKYLDWVKTSLN